VLEVSRGAERQVEPNRIGVVAAITPCSFPNMALCDHPRRRAQLRRLDEDREGRLSARVGKREAAVNWMS
jgi:hypothetical protein